MRLPLFPLICLFSTALAAPQSGGTQFKVNVANGSGGTVLADAAGSTRVFYQAGDGSIHVLSGSGISTGTNYHDQMIVAGGVAATGSPLAAAAPENDLNRAQIFFIGPDNTLKEYIFDPATQKWTAGNMGGLGNVPGSKYLWAVVDSTSGFRVGFERTENVLSMAYRPPTGAWSFVDL